jgi:hypothetical protein
MTTVFMIVAPILLITGITILAIGILYRIREQIIVSVGLLLLGLGFTVGVLALNKIDETLMTANGWRYPYVKLLEGGILNPFKGAISPSFVQVSAWKSSISLMMGASALIVVGVALLSYIGGLMLELEGWKAYIVPAIVIVLGFIGVYYMSASASKILYQLNIPEALKDRDLSAWLRTAAILIGFITVTLGATSLYIETKGREYLIYSIAYLLSAIGWGVFAVSFFTAFEKHAALQYIQEGTVSTPLAFFTAGGILIVLGAIGLLLASTVEVIGSALGGEEELGSEEELFEEAEEAGEVESEE